TNRNITAVVCSPAGKIQYAGGNLLYCDGLWAHTMGLAANLTACATAGEIFGTGTIYEFCDGSNWHLLANNNCQIQFTAFGSGTWTVPSDWNNAANTIEVIGGGAGGAATCTNACGGGGGGAYAKATNVTLTPGANVSYNVANGALAGVNGNNTYFCNSTS